MQWDFIIGAISVPLSGLLRGYYRKIDDPILVSIIIIINILFLVSYKYQNILSQYVNAWGGNNWDVYLKI